MSQYCPLCDQRLASCDKVQAEVTESSGAFVHKTCAELKGYDYNEPLREYPDTEDEILSLTGDSPTEGESVLGVEVRSVRGPSGWQFAAENPYNHRQTLQADSVRELFELLAHFTAEELSEKDDE